MCFQISLFARPQKRRSVRKCACMKNYHGARKLSKYPRWRGNRSRRLYISVQTTAAESGGGKQSKASPPPHHPFPIALIGEYFFKRTGSRDIIETFWRKWIYLGLDKKLYRFLWTFRMSMWRAAAISICYAVNVKTCCRSSVYLS